MSVVWERRIRRASSYEIKYLDFRLGFYRSSKGWVGKVISHPFSSEGSGICVSGCKFWRVDTWELADGADQTALEAGGVDPSSPTGLIGFIFEFLHDIKERYYTDYYEKYHLEEDEFVPLLTLDDGN